MLSVASIGEERCHQGDNGGHLSLDFVDARSSSAFIGKNIKAECLAPKEVTTIINILSICSGGFLDIVYLSPERANKSNAMQTIMTKLYNNNQLARVVIDEAHCLSSWGHDFRPDYQGLGFFKDKFPKVPIMALTATANEKCRWIYFTI